MQTILVLMIRCYRYAISPFLGHHCRFHPTCAHYAETAIVRHGVFKGGWLALRRLMRCHPWGSGGMDPVPEATTKPGKQSG